MAHGGRGARWGREWYTHLRPGDVGKVPRDFARCARHARRGERDALLELLFSSELIGEPLLLGIGEPLLLLLLLLAPNP